MKRKVNKEGRINFKIVKTSIKAGDIGQAPTLSINHTLDSLTADTTFRADTLTK